MGGRNESHLCNSLKVLSLRGTFLNKSCNPFCHMHKQKARATLQQGRILSNYRTMTFPICQKYQSTSMASKIALDTLLAVRKIKTDTQMNSPIVQSQTKSCVPRRTYQGPQANPQVRFERQCCSFVFCHFILWM